MPIGLKDNEETWQARWEADGRYQAEPDNRDKFFLNLPYPYINGRLHLGHGYSYIRGDVMARFERMRGRNVLFPFAFHCTGSPIVSAAKRISDGEPGQRKILLDMDVSEEEIPAFTDPLHWIRYFRPLAEADLRRLGMGVDWRRSFITTAENPAYDAFIRWQFLILREKGYVQQGPHPVIWCPSENGPAPDHSRSEGEGETPQEFTVLKFAMGERFLLAATLRPETVFGQTNLWVDPNVEYVIAEWDGSEHILARSAMEKLALQGITPVEKGIISGAELVGKTCVAPMIHREIPILPSTFLDEHKGTGLVTSVPSDAPDDWMSLRDLQTQPELRERLGVDEAWVKDLTPVAIISSEGWGDLPAVEICARMGIVDQNDREKLEAAKKEIYKSGFYTGKMLDNAGEYAGMPVEIAKVSIGEKLREDGEALGMFEPSGKVVCRCLAECVVKLVEDQWFITYGDPVWKQQTHAALAGMRLYPPEVYGQFDHVIDWLKDWACAREFGLGTQLPWAEDWVIESLSDSTIYMAYYTVAKYTEHEKSVPPEALTREFFDYVFLGKGDPDALMVPRELAERIRADFRYWYPFDYRGSGKDLIHNHLTFSIFIHLAVFGPELVPEAFGINGWLKVDGRKMSKSLGNFFTLRQILDEHGADVTRATLTYAGEGVDDPNWSSEFAYSITRQLEAWFDFATAQPAGREGEEPIDAWFGAVLDDHVARATAAYERTDYRTAFQLTWFDLANEWKWYQRRTPPSQALQQRYIEAVTRLITPIVPHLAEAIHQARGGAGSAVDAPFPVGQEAVPADLYPETFLRAVIDDIRGILKVTKMTPSSIRLFSAKAWKEIALTTYAAEGGMGHIGDVIKKTIPAVLKSGEPESTLRQVSKLLMRFQKQHPGGMREERAATIVGLDETAYLLAAADFLGAEFGCEVVVGQEGDPGLIDPRGKASFAEPGRPAIYIEEA